MTDFPSPDNRQTGEELERLRRQIDAIDNDLLSLLHKRQKGVEKIVALKKKHNLPVYHPAREEDLISDRREKATTRNLAPEFIEELFRLIMRRSRITQTDVIARRGVRPGTVLIAGGAGKLGAYLHQWFSRAAYTVRILEKDDWSNAAELCSGADLALVSVPINKTEDVIMRLGPLLDPECILADVTSIKKGPVDAMLKAHKGPVLGLHPVFGPNTTSMDKQLVLVTPGRKAEKCQWVIDQFAAWGNVILQTNPKQHDENMTIVQALRHFASFVFGQFLCEHKIDVHKTLEFSSPIYRLELGMVGRLFAQDPDLYASIIFASPERRAMLKNYIASLSQNLEMLEKGDSARFCTEFKKISEWFGSFSDQAIRESSYLIDKLTERF